MDLLEKYMEVISNSYSETTQKTYVANLKLFFKWLDNSNIRILNLSKYELYNYIAYIDNLSQNTKKNRLMAIRSFYYHYNKEMCKELFEDIIIFSQKRIPKYLSENQAIKLLQFYKGRNKLIIYLFLTTGIRVTELVNIKVEDVNLKKKKIKIITKNGIEREVFITDNCVKMLKKQMSEGYVFKIKQNDVRYIVKKAMKSLGIDGSVHTLRHTYATIMYKQTHDILLVQKLLGHKSLESTKIYVHALAEELKEGIEKMSEVLK